MTIRELIEELIEFPPNMEVVTYDIDSQNFIEVSQVLEVKISPEKESISYRPGYLFRKDETYTKSDDSITAISIE